MSRRMIEAARAIVGEGAALRAPVIGGSMLPWIWAGDRIIVQPVTAADIALGDLLVYERGAQLVAHRMIGRCRTEDGDYLITRGDWFMNADPPVRASSLIGKVIAIERGGWTIRLDRGLGRMVMTTTGWFVRRYPWLLAGLGRLWRGIKRWQW